MPAKKDRSHAQTISDREPTFEGIREIAARLEPPLRTGPRARASGPEALDHIRIACQPGGELHAGTECRRCARFVNWLPSPDRLRVTIRCLWRESDRAVDLMARASVIPSATENMSAAEAALRAASAGVPFLAVIEDGRFGGLVRAEQCERSLRTLVRDLVIRPSWSVPADATLQDVVATMKAHDTDIVPVLDGGTLLGVVTRVALCDAGLACAFDEP